MPEREIVSLSYNREISSTPWLSSMTRDVHSTMALSESSRHDDSKGPGSCITAPPQPCLMRRLQH